MDELERKTIPIHEIEIDPFQSRQEKWANDKDDRRLMESIRGVGLIHQPIVRPAESVEADVPVEKPYVCTAGGRRLRALASNGREEVECVVIDMDDLEALEISLAENTGRKELSDYEEVQTIRLWFDKLQEEKVDYTWECPEDECDDEIDGLPSMREHIGGHGLTVDEFEAEHGDTLPDLASVRCPVDGCGEIVSHSQQSLSLHLSSHTDKSESNFNEVYLREDASKEISRKHYGSDDETSVQNVREALRVAKLPDEVLALVKDPAERTPEEIAELEQHDISEEYVIGYRSGGRSVGRALASLDQELREAGESNRDEKLLGVLGDLHEEKREVVSKDLRALTKDVSEGKTFEAALTEHSDEEGEFEIVDTSEVTVRVPQRVWGVHKEKMLATNKSSRELVQEGYTEWLESQADDAPEVSDDA